MDFIKVHTLIGSDVLFRVRNGSKLWEAAMYNDNTPGNKIRIARLESTENGLKTFARYVDPYTDVQIIHRPV